MDQAGLRQKDVAAACDCKYQTVGKWLGGSWPGGEYIMRLCRALDTDPGYLLEGVSAAPGSATGRDLDIARAEVAAAVKTAVDAALERFTAEWSGADAPAVKLARAARAADRRHRPRAADPPAGQTGSG